MSNDGIIKINDSTQLSAVFSDVYKFWLSKSKDGRLPGVSDFKLDELPIKILPWSIIADVITDDGDTDYKFRFWGTQRASLIGFDMTGKFLSEIGSKDMRDGNTVEYEYVMKHKAPILCQTPIVTSTGRSIAMNSIRLPLSDNGERVARVFSAIDPDNVTSEHYAHFGTDPSRM
ncbi:PAS domain-containing protein [Rhodospirillales bacterium]|nr:PAS domain-containing protein [Rhodospirillales bacterium]